MKTSFAILVLTFISLTANANCVDLSGTYSSPFNNSQIKTTYVFNQQACESVTVNSIIFNGGIQTTTAEFLLDGIPLNNCILDAFNSCGTLKISELGIKKMDPKRTHTGDEIHGLCTFTYSLLTKDATANLVETIQDAQCEDGYSGPLKPTVYQKQ